MPPAELLEELRSSQPFLDDFPYEWVPDNEVIYRIGVVVQAILECLECHEEPRKNIEERGYEWYIIILIDISLHL